MLSLLAITLAAQPAHADDQPVEVVTWNAWGLPAPLATDRRGRLPTIARWLDERGADVAGLQEVWRGARGLIDRLRPHLPSGAARDSGLALVTPHPVHDLQLHTFVASRGVDSWKGKGVLEATVDIDGSPVQVAVTHLQSGGSRRSARVRTDQVQELIAHLADAAHPTVLMGDFNLYDEVADDDRTLRSLRDAGFVDAAAVVGERGGTYPGCRHRFDRIFVRDGASAGMVPATAAVLDEASELSDHLPVVATVALTGDGG